ncbi:MAG TPA: OstA-like protein, partial [Balneolaceae bacterium]|nr:OstA-like protein [Balneolaceae bacterium]
MLTEIPVLAHSQQRVQVVEADSAVVVTVNGKPVQKIWGHVHLKAEEMEMFADRAVKYSAEDLIEAFGNIQINTDQEIIWADTLTYYTDLDFAELRSRVIIKSDSSTLFGNAVDYRFTNKVAHFLDRFQLVDSSGVLAADRGFYFRRPDSAAFRGHVQLQDSSNYAEGKYLFSNRKREYYELHEKVFAFDKENNTKLSGDYLESDSTGRSVVTGNAWLINYESNADSTASPDSLKPLRVDSSNVTPDSTQLMQSGHMNLFQPDSLFAPPDTAKNDSTSQPDTTHIKARRIVSTQNRKPADTTTTIRAYENVRIWSPDFAAVSDSARYESKEDVFELWEEAKIWYNQIQLSSPYIWIQLAEGDVKKLIAYPDPFVVRRDSVIDRLNQIKGDSLAAFFEDGTLKRMEVYPNSHI